MAKNNKIVVTGTGVVSALGYDSDTLWNALLEKKSAVKNILFSRCGHGAIFITCWRSVDDFDILNFFENDKGVKRYGRVTNFALAATRGAILDAGFKFCISRSDSGRLAYDIDAPDMDRWGIVLGIGVQNMDVCEKYHALHLKHGGPKRVSPFAFAIYSNQYSTCYW